LAKLKGQKLKEPGFGLRKTLQAGDMIERTLSIVKPDAVGKNRIGKVISYFEAAGLRMVAGKLVRLTADEVGRFYVIHRDKEFYQSLIRFMSSGPVFVMVLEGENAIARVRDIMGATNPAQAAPDTIRRAIGTDVEKNAVHGSDAPETARWEIGFFFGQIELQEP
jgi:nucleoside-diphosphate kinase